MSVFLSYLSLDLSPSYIIEMVGPVRLMIAVLSYLSPDLSPSYITEMVGPLCGS